MASAVDVFVAYQFVKILSTPWEKTDAYKLGIIDEKGNLLKKRRELTTSKEKKAYTIFHTLVWNIKRILDKLPPTRTRIGSFAAALWMLKEELETNQNVSDMGPTIMMLEEVIADSQKEFGLQEKMVLKTFLSESKAENTLKKGDYILITDVDTHAGPARAGDTIKVPKDIEAFDSIAGEPVFRVKHPRDKNKDLVVAKDNLARKG